MLDYVTGASRSSTAMGTVQLYQQHKIQEYCYKEHKIKDER